LGRIYYSGPLHDEAEIEAVCKVLRSGPEGLKIGANVAEMERSVAPMFAKEFGVMCNSGSSALFLAFAVAALPPGSEVVTSVLTFSTDVSAITSAGLVPVFIDVEPDTYNVDVELIEGAISDKTRALMFPNLIGNAPDWDRIREIADRHDLMVIEDSCDLMGAQLRGRPTGSRSDISATSFAITHFITCGGNGGMVMFNDSAQADRAYMLRRWGRRSEVQFFGSRKGEHNFFEDLDGIRYDSTFIFDELPWNFEPSEMGAAYGVVQLGKLSQFVATRRRNFDLHQEYFSQYPDLFITPRQLEGLDAAWMGYPLQIRPEAGFVRGELQQFLDAADIDTRTIWSGNVTRQPMMQQANFRSAEGGFPNADAVMEWGLLVTNNHAHSAEQMYRIHEEVEKFLNERIG
jgi:CDP-4-dehydro-6-deoxyglucose reductase, E1